MDNSMFGNRVSKDIDDIKVFEKTARKNYIYCEEKFILDDSKLKKTIHFSLITDCSRGYHDRIRS
jgi:hypothetical protein